MQRHGIPCNSSALLLISTARARLVLDDGFHHAINNLSADLEPANAVAIDRPERAGKTNMNGLITVGKYQPDDGQPCCSNGVIHLTRLGLRRELRTRHRPQIQSRRLFEKPVPRGQSVTSSLNFDHIVKGHAVLGAAARPRPRRNQRGAGPSA